jgi:hypothetical protein
MAAAALLALNALAQLALRQIKKFQAPSSTGSWAQSRLAINRSVRHMTCIGAPKVGAGL